MLFNSYTFIIFFCIFCIGWPFARKSSNLRWLYIISFSLFFYGWWSWKYIFLLLLTGLVDFYASLGIYYYCKYSKIILLISIISNILLLGYFKFWNLIAHFINEAIKYFDLTGEIAIHEIVLPVAISFYTFQSMSYSIDVFNKKCKPTTNFLHFVAAISFFPHLVAGPIMRASKLLPQLLEWRPANRVERLDGLRLIAHGFFKKVVIADNLAPAIGEAFSGQVSAHSGLDWWIVVTMFAMQIYCDFSGYSDIARGLAKWLGYEFTLNFDHPYAAKSLKEFWGRWHISLSTWFRDYVYIPLGGSKHGEIRAYILIIIVMILSAIWHGAAITFLIWGGTHALLLCLERFIGWPKWLNKFRYGYMFSWAITIIFVWIAWIFFRSTNITQGLEILCSMFTIRNFQFDISLTALGFLILGIFHEVYTYQTERKYVGHILRWNEALILVSIIVACVYLRGPGNSFIYFQF